MIGHIVPAGSTEPMDDNQVAAATGMPDLIPPIDRQRTFSFFTGQKVVPGGRAAFLDWFPQLASIGTRCQEPIRDTINHAGIHGHR